jgi:hypothetical protein
LLGFFNSTLPQGTYDVHSVVNTVASFLCSAHLLDVEHQRYPDPRRYLWCKNYRKPSLVSSVVDQWPCGQVTSCHLLLNSLDLATSVLPETSTNNYILDLPLHSRYLHRLDPQRNWKESPGFITLYHLIPSWYFAKALFYNCLGASFIMFAITYSLHIQAIFLTPFAQYLGRISFGLCLLHAQLLCSLGIRVMSAGVKLAGWGDVLPVYCGDAVWVAGYAARLRFGRRTCLRGR